MSKSGVQPSSPAPGILQSSVLLLASKRRRTRNLNLADHAARCVPLLVTVHLEILSLCHGIKVPGHGLPRKKLHLPDVSVYLDQCFAPCVEDFHLSRKDPGDKSVRRKVMSVRTWIVDQQLIVLAPFELKPAGEESSLPLFRAGFHSDFYGFRWASKARRWQQQRQHSKPTQACDHPSRQRTGEIHGNLLFHMATFPCASTRTLKRLSFWSRLTDWPVSCRGV